MNAYNPQLVSLGFPLIHLHLIQHELCFGHVALLPNHSWKWTQALGLEGQSSSTEGNSAP